MSSQPLPVIEPDLSDVSVALVDELLYPLRFGNVVCLNFDPEICGKVNAAATWKGLHSRLVSLSRRRHCARLEGPPCPATKYHLALTPHIAESFVGECARPHIGPLPLSRHSPWEEVRMEVAAAVYFTISAYNYLSTYHRQRVRKLWRNRGWFFFVLYVGFAVIMWPKNPSMTSKAYHVGLYFIRTGTRFNRRHLSSKNYDGNMPWWSLSFFCFQLL
jgi:hypothetical protein